MDHVAPLPKSRKLKFIDKFRRGIQKSRETVLRSTGNPRAVSSAGRAPRSQRGGRGFESLTVHQSCSAERQEANRLAELLSQYSIPDQWAFSSVGERLLHTQEVAGSIPATPIRDSGRYTQILRPWQYRVPTCEEKLCLAVVYSFVFAICHSFAGCRLLMAHSRCA
jgi:hypothetical protein